jgi:hypothetical protein
MVRINLVRLKPLSHMVWIRQRISQRAVASILEMYRIGSTLDMHMLYACLTGRFELNFMYWVYWNGRALRLSNFWKV